MTAWDCTTARLAGAWRQQPCTPAYCTELPPDELQTALTLADRNKAPQLRQELMAYFSEGGDHQNHDHLIARRIAL